MNALAPNPAVCQVNTVDGAVLLDAEHGRLYGLNPVGGAVWQALLDDRSVEQITDDLAARFAAPPERIRADVDALIIQLCDLGLLAGPGPRQ